MTTKLDGSRLVDINMARFNTQNPFIGIQHSIDDSGIGLSATYKKEHVGIRLAACIADFCFSRCAVIIQAVSRSPIIVGLDQPLEDGLMAAIVVIAFERNHN